jgi:hypothetical protein
MTRRGELAEEKVGELKGLVVAAKGAPSPALAPEEPVSARPAVKGFPMKEGPLASL